MNFLAPDSARAWARNLEAAPPGVPAPALAAELARAGLDAAALTKTHPHLFARAEVFVAPSDLARMAELIAAIESVAATPAYRAALAAWVPEIARSDPGYPSVFFGYDFHLTPAGPRLIEINTNAGGGFLAACQARAAGDGPWPEAGADFVTMFADAWQGWRGRQPLRRIAIVDADPDRQYLAPEFALMRAACQAAGYRAEIAAPEALVWDGARLCLAGEPLDLVYNRLTDFALAGPECAGLAAAYAAGAVLLTPHPHAYAHLADKRNLTVLSDPDWLASAGIAPELRERLLSGVPRSVRVEAAAGETFWQTRRQWFFKPASGFGSRAAYRGDKLTRKVFDGILAGDYIAQALVPPPERALRLEGGVEHFKFDLRNYVYRGRVQLVAARLYQGQTTNFRTPGGGFAVVRTPPADAEDAAC